MGHEIKSRQGIRWLLFKKKETLHIKWSNLRNGCFCIHVFVHTDHCAPNPNNPLYLPYSKHCLSSSPVSAFYYEQGDQIGRIFAAY
jgi:hypothetical protein